MQNKNIKHIFNVRFEICTQTIQVEVFWVMTPCSDVVEYQCFGGTCCLHLQGEVNAGKGGTEIGSISWGRV
jgi:hypothetical protein